MPRHSALIEGPPGTGKSTLIRSAAGLVDRVFLLTNDTGAPMIFGKEVDGFPEVTFGKECDGTTFHYRYLPTARPSFAELRASAHKIHTTTIKKLQEIETGLSRQGYDQFLQVIDECAGFTCDCCGKDHGAADDWTPRDLFVYDHLTALSTMSMDLTVGAKPVKTQPEWGVAMDNLERLVSKFVHDLACNFILLAHISREKDEITGGVNITMYTLGNKLAPKIVGMFDEVVMSKKTGDGFLLSTNEANCDLKNRYLPLSSKIPPDLAYLLKDVRE